MYTAGTQEQLNQHPACYVTPHSISSLCYSESALNILRYYANVSYCEYCYSYGCELSRCHVQLFVSQWTVAHQAPLSMEFSTQEYWSGLPFPTLIHMAVRSLLKARGMDCFSPFP